MKILYDFQVFSWQRHGGISRYFAELINIAKDDPNVKAEVSIIHSVNAYLDQFKIKKAEKRTLLYRIKNRIGKRLGFIASNNYEYTKKILRLNAFDIFHPTYYEDYFLEELKGPLVVTVYDMIHEKFPEFFDKTDQTSRLKRRLVEHANKVIAISESTKTDLVKIFGIKPEKIEVIYLGHPKKQTLLGNLPEVLDNYNGRYLLFVGERGKYKNFTSFASASAKFMIEHGIKLVCFGGGIFTQSELNHLETIGIDKLTIQLSGEDSLLFKLYSQAFAFCFPSLYEGFGLPVLESIQYGCLPILEVNDCLVEVGGNAAVYADTKVPNSWYAALDSVLNNSDLVAQVKSNGQNRLEKFTWEKTYKETRALYAQVLEESKTSKTPDK